LQRFLAGHSIERISRERGLKESTVMGHLALAVEGGEQIDLSLFVNEQERDEIAEAFGQFGMANLTVVREHTGGRFDYGVLRICRAVLRVSRPELAVVT
jgi:uncharacterized protein YpbB